MDQKYSFDLTTGSNDEGHGTFQAGKSGAEASWRRAWGRDEACAGRPRPV